MLNQAEAQQKQHTKGQKSQRYSPSKDAQNGKQSRRTKSNKD